MLSLLSTDFFSVFKTLNFPNCDAGITAYVDQSDIFLLDRWHVFFLSRLNICIFVLQNSISFFPNSELYYKALIIFITTTANASAVLTSDAPIHNLIYEIVPTD